MGRIRLGYEGVIDDQRQAVLVRDGCNGIDIGDIAVGVAPRVSR